MNNSQQDAVKQATQIFNMDGLTEADVNSFLRGVVGVVTEDDEFMAKMASGTQTDEDVAKAVDYGIKEYNRRFIRINEGEKGNKKLMMYVFGMLRSQLV